MVGSDRGVSLIESTRLFLVQMMAIMMLHFYTIFRIGSTDVKTSICETNLHDVTISGPKPLAYCRVLVL